MSENIEKVLSRGEKLDLLVDKTDNLMFEVGDGTACCTPSAEDGTATQNCLVLRYCTAPRQTSSYTCQELIASPTTTSHAG